MTTFEVKVYYLGTIVRNVEAEDSKKATEIALNSVNLSSEDTINSIFVKQIENHIANQ